MGISMHLTQLVLSSSTLINEIFCGSFLVKNLVVFVRATITAECILSLNHSNRKVVGGKHNVVDNYSDASATGPFGAVFCNPFK
jgi:hypothetical protein